MVSSLLHSGYIPTPGNEYKWNNSLAHIRWADLPTLGKIQSTEIIETFESRCIELGFKLVKKNGTKEQHLIDPPEVRPAEQSAEPPSLFPEDQKGEAGVGKDAAAPYLTFEEFDKANSADPGRLQIEDYVVKGVLKDVDPTSLDYQGWMKVGMALYHQFGGDEKGYDLWEEVERVRRCTIRARRDAREVENVQNRARQSTGHIPDRLETG